ncbi:ankyrin repeat-containing domain protein [Corynascus similis CBS 632.67]
MPTRSSAGHTTTNVLLRSFDDKKEQKRMQNRIAQRTYRQNQKQRVQALEAAGVDGCNEGCGTSGPTQQISPPPTTIHVSDHRNVYSVAGATPISQDTGAALDDPSLWPINNQDVNLNLSEPSPPPPPIPMSSAGRTPLHLAVCNGNEAMTLLLLESCADVARQDSSGCTPLHLAAEAGHDAIVKMLLSKSATPTL